MRLKNFSLMGIIGYLGFMGLTISLYPKAKALVTFAILAMVPLSTFPLFAAVALFFVFISQKEGNGEYR